MPSKKRYYKNNFSLADYIYLRFDDFKSSKELQGLQKIQRNTKINEVQNKLNKNFKTQTGYSVEEFMKVLKANMQSIFEINKLFNQTTIKDFLDLNNDDEISSFLSEAKDVEILKTTGFVVSSTTMLNKIFANKSEKKEIEDTIKKLESIGSLDKARFNAILKKVKNNEDIALSYQLMDMILEKANNLLLESDGKGGFRAKAIKDFNVTDYFKSLDTHWSIVKNELSRSAPNVDRIKEELNKVRRIINKDIKGKNLGELSGKIILNPIVKELVEKNATKNIQTAIQHTATKPNQNVSFKVTPKTVTGKGIIFSLELSDDPLTTLRKGFAEGSFKEMVSDVTAILTSKQNQNIKEKKIGMSVKTLKVDAKKVVLSNSISLAAALKLANTSTSKEILNGTNTNRRSVFLNAMNFALAQSDFIQEKDPFVIRSTGKSSGSFSIAKLDDLTKGAISDVAIDIYSSMFKSQVAALIDINGAILPTPVYFKYVMEQFRRNEKKNKSTTPISNIIEFNSLKGASSYRKKIIEGGSNNVNDKYRAYGVLAGTRNGFALQRIFEQTVTIKAYYIKPEEYYKLIQKYK